MQDSKTIAIMQPYFLPYAGYFRLFAQSDVFVIYDCVQFPRRGWVHRNRFTDNHKNLAWLTLPLKKAPQETKICDLEFDENAEAIISRYKDKFPILKNNHPIIDSLHNTNGKSPTGYLSSLLQQVCKELQIPCKLVFSSQLDIEPDLKGQNRIIAICKKLDAGKYINSPGGKDLYNKDDFAKNNIKLEFLPQFEGPMQSVLEVIINQGAEKTASLIKQESYSKL